MVDTKKKKNPETAVTIQTFQFRQTKVMSQFENVTK